MDNKTTDETGTVKAGKVQIVGVAMGGTRKVRSVKVLLMVEKLEKSKVCWTKPWQICLEAVCFRNNFPGSYNIASLASNGSDKQPKLRMENRRGYAHNGWMDHSVNITVIIIL